MSTDYLASDITEFDDPLSNYDPPVYSDELLRSLAEVPITSVVMQPYAAVSPETPVFRAVQALAGLKVSALLVVEQGRLVGIFTERDVLNRVAECFGRIKEAPVRSVMTTNPLALRDSDPIGAALTMIAASGYRHVPVTDTEQRVLGVVSPRRIFSAIDQLMQSLN